MGSGLFEVRGGSVRSASSSDMEIPHPRDKTVSKKERRQSDANYHQATKYHNKIQKMRRIKADA